LTTEANVKENSSSECLNCCDKRFVTTHWSVVLVAAGSNSTQALAALERLCRAYWYPLYVFVRRLGHKPPDAEDIVQGFFERCLEKNYFAIADQAKGRFRSFLLLMLKRYMAKEWEKACAQKRGKGRIPLMLDSLLPEERYAKEPVNDATPEKLYERRWALTLLEKVLARLRQEQAAAERLSTYENLKDCLTTSARTIPYAVAARKLRITEGAVKVAVHRLRRRYRELLEAEIALTVSSPAEINDERQHLFSVLSQ
jgi:RNA polymerase sigma factor (sigma-70 family)